ncbi:MAG TPA: aquaporin [Chloroflexia bacterium]|nr:aquaporin [Chloroflexia bacterium]
MKLHLLRRAGAELVGTYALVPAGCGAIMVDATTHALTHVGVAATFGLIILGMIAATGHISGAHFNPAVSVAFALARHFPWREVPAYIGVRTFFGGKFTLRSAGNGFLEQLWGSKYSPTSLPLQLGGSRHPARHPNGSQIPKLVRELLFSAEFSRTSWFHRPYCQTIHSNQVTNVLEKNTP